jgi:hypothetical protein
MMNTKYIIKMKIPTRPDLDYYYTGKNDPLRPGPLFDYRRPKAKRYSYIEEAYRDMQIISAVIHDETLTVEKIKCRM